MDWLIEIHISDSEADVDAVYNQIENLLFNMGQVGTLSIRQDDGGDDDANPGGDRPVS